MVGGCGGFSLIRGCGGLSLIRGCGGFSLIRGCGGLSLIRGCGGISLGCGCGGISLIGEWDGLFRGGVGDILCCWLDGSKGGESVVVELSPNPLWRSVTSGNLK